MDECIIEEVVAENRERLRTLHCLTYVIPFYTHTHTHTHTHTKGDISYQEVALKALTKEWKYADCYSIQPPDQDLPLPPSKPLSRKSILDGFSNLKKELSILSPLKHTHVIQLYRVMLRLLVREGGRGERERRRREGEGREGGGGGERERGG